MHLLSSIQNFLPISPKLLTGGQPFADQLALLKDAGCEVVINLAAPESPDYIADEADRIRASGLEYIAIPVAWSAPAQAELEAFCAALSSNRDRTVFAHCARNMRVSAFTFLYRVIVLKEDEAVCREDMEKIWHPDGVWAEFIRQNLLVG